MQISINNLTKRYPSGKYAIRDIGLEIGNGLFGLLGPNGAGKTTLMKILVTLLKPTRGELTVNGMDIRKNRRDIRRLIGYLPQDFSVFSKLTVWEFLDYSACLCGIRSKKERTDRIYDTLEKVGLFEARDRMTVKLSGGMKRRLGIAQVLVGDPQIMVVDEPTVGLDPEERVRFRNLLTDLTAQDRIILLSTHIVGDISSTCSNIALLDDGHIIFNGPPEDLITQSQGKVWTISSTYEELDILKSKYPVISTVPSEAGYELRIVAEDLNDSRAKPAEPNLEDAYIHFMQAEGGGVLDEDGSGFDWMETQQ